MSRPRARPSPSAGTSPTTSAGPRPRCSWGSRARRARRCRGSRGLRFAREAPEPHKEKAASSVLEAASVPNSDCDDVGLSCRSPSRCPDGLVEYIYSSHCVNAHSSHYVFKCNDMVARPGRRLAITGSPLVTEAHGVGAAEPHGAGVEVGAHVMHPSRRDLHLSARPRSLV